MISLAHKYCGQQSHIYDNDVHHHLQAENVVGCIRQLHIVQLVVGFGVTGMVPRLRIHLEEIAGEYLSVSHNEWA
jgi:hypothetical protein